MNKWRETVKRIAKQHPGKSLREILPIAKQEYKKIKHVSHPTKHHKKSHTHKRTRGRKVMRGGDGHSTSDSDSNQFDSNQLDSNPVLPANENAYDLYNINNEGPSLIPPSSCSGQSGGSHCNTYKKPRRRKRPPTRRRRRKGKKKRN